MSRRGRKRLEERFGETRFKALLKAMSIPDIAEQICEHQIDKEKKRKCEACRRAIYRAEERIEASEKADKTYEPIAEFKAIPEIHRFIEFSKAKRIKDRNLKNQLSQLCRMWNWIRESERTDLIETQRPILWEMKHVQYVLPKIDELQIGRYNYIQALRHFFKSANKDELLKEPLLAAKRKDQRSPKGPRRSKDRFTPQEYIEKIRPLLREDALLALDLHVTLKCRESTTNDCSLIGLEWENVNWNDAVYGFPTVTVTVHESKTNGGTDWEHCPVDLWFADLSSRLRIAYEKRTSDRIFDFKYDTYLLLYHKLEKKLGWPIRPHDCRRSAGGWLRDLGLSDLAIGQYDTKSGKAVGFTGVGWENAEIYYRHYGKMNPLAIYDKKQRLDTSMFNGLINKMVEQKQW
jgi:integrase